MPSSIGYTAWACLISSNGSIAENAQHLPTQIQKWQSNGGKDCPRERSLNYPITNRSPIQPYFWKFAATKILRQGIRLMLATVSRGISSWQSGRMFLPFG